MLRFLGFQVKIKPLSTLANVAYMKILGRHIRMEA
jgi:hypothetical protein